MGVPFWTLKELAMSDQTMMTLFLCKVKASGLCGMVNLKEVDPLQSNQYSQLLRQSTSFIICLGPIPYDGVARKVVVTLHPALTSIMMIFAGAGIAFAIVCLVFSFAYRNAR